MEEHNKQKEEKLSDSFGAWAKHFFRPMLEDVEPYGWVIEWNITSQYYGKDGKPVWVGGEHWSMWHNHKVYPTKEIALAAIKASETMSNGEYSKIKYRILPVYSGEPEVLDNVMDLPLKIE